MPIALPKESREDAMASLSRYFEEHFDGPLGSLAASQLLDFVLEELGPNIYNRAVVEAQERLQARVAELDSELFQDEFQYWRRRRKGR